MTLPPTVTTTRDGFASIEMGWSGPGIFLGLSAMICLLLNWKWHHRIQKPRHVGDEQRGILVLRAVICVGIEDELGVRQVLLQDERIHGVDDHVLAAIHDQRRLADRLQIFERLLPRRAPFADRLDLGGRDFLVDLGIAVLGAQPEALEELAACSLALRGPREMHAKPKMIGLVIGGAEDFLRLWRERSHALAAARAGADQDEAPHEVGRLKGDLLSDKAADRKAEHIDFPQAQRPDERHRVAAHFLERSWHLSGGTGDTGVVEQDHFAVLGETVGHRRIPMVHGAGEVLVEDERHAGCVAKAAIGKADAVGFDEPRRRGLVSVNHLVGPFYSVGTAPGKSARAAVAQSTSFCTVGAPLTPIAPTTSPFTLVGNPPPHAATRASVGMPAKSDGSPWIKLKKS